MPVRPRLLLTLCSVLLLIAACGSSGPQGTGTPHPVTPTASPATANHTPEPAGDIGDAPVHIPVAGQAPQAGVPWYLAIGDSITFGFSADPARFGTNSSWALQLQDLRREVERIDREQLGVNEARAITNAYNRVRYGEEKLTDSERTQIESLLTRLERKQGNN